MTASISSVQLDEYPTKPILNKRAGPVFTVVGMLALCYLVKTKSVFSSLGLSFEVAKVLCTHKITNLQNRSLPSKPTSVDSYEVSCGVRGAAISVNHLCLAAMWSGLHIVDASDRENLKFAGLYKTSSFASGVDLFKNHVYLACDLGLEIVDVNDLSDPKLIATYPARGAFDVLVHEDYAYLSSTSGLDIIDVSDSSYPKLACSYEMGAWAWRTALFENHAYVAGTWSGLHILDITDPSSPEQIGSYTPSSSVWAAAVSGENAYVACGSTVEILDISDLSNPKLKAEYPSNGAVDVAVFDDFLLVASDSGVDIVDVSNPANPKLECLYDMPNGAWEIVLFEDCGCAVVGDTSLHIIDLDS